MSITSAHLRNTGHSACQLLSVKLGSDAALVGVDEGSLENPGERTCSELVDEREWLLLRHDGQRK
jgi:hypothetical protein